MSDGHNWHSVYTSIGVLLIECKNCNHRAAIDKNAAQLNLHEGNKKTIASTKFRCLKCKHTAFRAYIPRSRDQVDLFLADDPVRDMMQAAY